LFIKLLLIYIFLLLGIFLILLVFKVIPKILRRPVIFILRFAFEFLGFTL